MASQCLYKAKAYGSYQVKVIFIFVFFFLSIGHSIINHSRKLKKMSWKAKACAFAGAVAAVEELRYKKLCEWNFSLPILCNRHVNNNMEPLSSISSYAKTETKRRSKGQNLKQPEESLRIVMYLSCWGPN